MPADPEQVIEGVSAALREAAREDRWPDPMPLTVAVDELSRWVDDERQWMTGSPRNWKSLADDLLAALAVLGQETRSVLRADEIRRELEACRRLLSEEATRTDPALRHRLRILVRMLRERYLTVEARVAAWIDLTKRAGNLESAEPVARQMLGFCAAYGFEAGEVTNLIERSLRRRESAQSPQESSEQRLDAARQALTFDIPQRHVVVWYRYFFAPMAPMWLDIGEHVRIYRSDWLRPALQDAENHPELPPEAKTRMGLLEMFTTERPAEQEGPEVFPVAYIRIDVGKEIHARALTIARDTAEAIASLGVIRGADPLIWQLDNSYVTFVDGEDGAGHTEAAVADTANAREAQAVRTDRTAEGLADMADQLGPRLPVRDARLHAVATLLGWLREAQNSRTPLRLVLYDRVIEAVAGWAGVNSLPRFIQDSLVPQWIYAQIRNSIFVAGWTALHAGAVYPTGSAERRWSREIVNHPALEVSMVGGRTRLGLRGVLSELAWLLERVPADSDAHSVLTRLDRRTESGQATAKWWDELSGQAARMEARRLRTRNALTHGGPIAPGTVDAVGVFAEQIAGEALAGCVEAHLLGEEVIDHFLTRNRHLDNVKARVRADEPPAEALFWED
jgi:hypothetical protein